MILQTHDRCIVHCSIRLYKAGMSTSQTDLDLPLYTVAVAATAAQMNIITMRMWFTRGAVKLFEPTGDIVAALPPVKRGLERLLTLRTVLTLATAATLVRRGTEVADAYQAAMRWTYVADGYGDPLPGQPRPIPRDPADLYASPDQTVLIHYGGAEAKVVRYRMEEAIPYPDLFKHRGADAIPTLVSLDEIDRRVRRVCDNFLKRGGDE